MPPGRFCSISLPANFRSEDIFAFHRRDPLAGSERVSADSLHKGLIWDGQAACLVIRCAGGRAESELRIDGEGRGDLTQRLLPRTRRMLGLTQPVEAFEQHLKDHPQLGALIAAQPGLRVAVASSPFEALSWAIIGQQISVAAAISIRRRMIHAAGLYHSSGMRCYPGAGEIAGLSAETLRQAGFSASKARSLLNVAELVASGKLPLDSWMDSCPVDQIREQLLAVNGIGPWTVNYTLLRGFGWLDGSLHGDVAVRRGLQQLLGREEKIDAQEAEDWLAEFTPWRALVAAHLWALKSATAY